MPQYLFTAKIKDAIVAGIRDCGEAIFMDSQQHVPVDKGTLKKSGTIRKITNGIKITYRAKHAAPIEFGYGKHNEIVKRHAVRAHFRKYRHYHSVFNVKTGKKVTHILGPIHKVNGVNVRTIKPVHIKRKMKRANWQAVKAHSRGPYQRTINSRVGRFYLRNAIDNWYPDLGVFIQKRLP